MKKFNFSYPFLTSVHCRPLRINYSLQLQAGTALRQVTFIKTYRV